MILVNKPLGKTPFEMVKKVKKLPQYKDEVIGYAGRLDPMANGLLLLLVGEENKKRKKFERLKKRYEFTMLAGISTDSYDLLGMILNSTQVRSNMVPKNLSSILSEYIGMQTQSYPPFSSVRVNGKALFYWARSGQIDEVVIPSKQIEIYSFALDGCLKISSQNLHTIIQKKLRTIHGDFRQKNILNSWKRYFEKNKYQHILISCSISCSSGTYIRQLVHDLSDKIQIPLVTYSIVRTTIGTYSLQDAIEL